MATTTNRIPHGWAQWVNFNDHDVYNCIIMKMLPKRGNLSTSRWASKEVRGEACAQSEQPGTRASKEAVLAGYVAFLKEYAVKYPAFECRGSTNSSFSSFSTTTTNTKTPSSPTSSLNPLANSFSLQSYSTMSFTIKDPTISASSQGLKGSLWASPSKEPINGRDKGEMKLLPLRCQFFMRF
jgi:hypothetical protein